MDDNKVEIALVRIETKLDASLLQGSDHEARLRRLEKLVYLAAGAAATVGGTAGVIAQQIMGA